MIEKSPASTGVSGIRSSLAAVSSSLRDMLRVASVLLLVIGVAALIIPAGAVFAATIVVTDAADAIHPGCSTTGTGTCSLRDAIIFANSNPGADTVVFSPGLNGVPITLSIPNAGGNNEDNSLEGDLDINDDLTIQGNGPSNTIIQAGTNNANGIDKVFGLNPICDHPVNVTIGGVTVRYGRNTQPFGAPDWSYTGGGIDWCGYDSGSLTISNSVISDNTNVNAYGGGLNIDTVLPGSGTVTITNTTITNNRTLSTTHEANGAGINFFGDRPNLVITDSTISNNSTAGTTAGGAGIYIRPTYGGSVAVRNSAVSGNTAGGNGGGIYVNMYHPSTSVVIDQGTRIINNISGGVPGGSAGGSGIFIGGATLTTTPVTLSKVIITGNSESTFSNPANRKGGGGIYVDGANVAISFSRIVNNTVLSANGGTGLLKNIDAGAVTALDNWWGCSTGPAAAPCDTAVILAGSAGSLASTPYLRLSLVAGSPTIKTNETSALTASFNTNSSGADVSANIDLLRGLPVLWSAVGGTITGSQATIQPSGTATATFNATAAGADSASALVDNGPATAPITVVKADTTATVTSDTPDPTVTGQPVTVSYTVSSETGSTPTAPSGNVTVTDGVDSCTGTLAAGSCTITLTTSGAKTLTATYNGDGNFNASPASVSETHTVNRANTATTIISRTPDPSVVGQAVTVSFTTAAVAPGGGTPTGNVTVSDGVNSCTGTVASGSCSITFASTGSKTLTATYAGDGNFNGSVSASVAHTVDKANTTTTIASHTPDPSTVGQSVTVSYSVVVAAPAAGTPTGTVTVSDGTVSCTATAEAGSCVLTPVTSGVRTLTATYAGDANFNASSGAASHTVNCPVITVNPATIPHGSSGAAYTQTFTQTGGTPPITYSETGVLPNGASFVGDTLSGTPTEGGTFPITITASDASGCSGSRSYTLIINRTVIVTTASDSGPGSLRQAISDALSGDTIAFDPTLNGQTITLTSGELVIGKDLTINGPDTDGVTVNGSGGFRVFSINSGVDVALNNLTITGGAAISGGGLNNAGGMVTLSNCSLVGNAAANVGGGISSTGTMTIVNTTISGNSAANIGGGISNSGTLTIINSTVSANSAADAGGIFNSGTMAAAHCTISGNSSGNGRGGDGIFNLGGTVNLGTSIVAGNSPVGDPDINGTFNSQGYNLIGNTGGAVINGDVTGNIYGRDPLLAPLGDNGGPTFTHALLSGSPAINAIPNGTGGCGTTTTADQRGILRPQGGACDMGAYERGDVGSISATAGTPQSAIIGDVFPTPLRVAVADELGVPLGGVTVTFEGPGSGPGIVSGGTAVTAPDGTASLTVTANGTAGGPYVVTAAAGTLAAGFTLTNTMAGTMTTIVSDTPDPSTAGQGVTISYAVTVTPPGSGVPTGIVTVTDGIDTCSGPVAAGSCGITFSSVGTKTLTAVYGGDANFTGSTSAGVIHTVSKGNTTTTIDTHGPDPSVVGQAVTVSFTVLSAFGTPAGNVTVTDGVDSCSGTVAAGSCSIALTTPGVRSLTAIYAGNAIFNDSASAAVAHTVNDQPPSYTLTVTKAGDGNGAVTGAGIDCGAMCSNSYGDGTVVTLTAMAGSGSVFSGWSGACAGAGLCSVTMSAETSVTATFTAAPEDAFSAIRDIRAIAYEPAVLPVLTTDPGTARPIGLGSAAAGEGVLDVTVGLHPFTEPVDLYLMLYVPSVDPDDFYLLKPDNSPQKLSGGLVKWKEGQTGAIDERLFTSLPVSSLPEGTYELYLMATPAGNRDMYYLWGTSLFVPGSGRAIALPAGQDAYTYEARAFPSMSESPEHAMPMGFGSIGLNGRELGLSETPSAGDTVKITIGLNAFTGPVDLYLAFYAPAIDPDNYYLMKPDNTLQKLSDGIAKWREGHEGVVNEQVSGEIPVTSLPPGRYEVHLFAAPAGSLENYYGWTSVFEVR